MAFAAFLRSGEFTWDTWSSKHHQFHLSRKHVAFNSNGSVTITLPASKTDPFRAGIRIQLAASLDSPLCPVSALRQLLQRYPQALHDPLFTRPQNIPFNRQFLASTIRDLLLNAGISTLGFTGHSLRKGAAVTAAENGLSRNDIKLLGRWKSDAVDVYINELNETDNTRKLLQLNSQLHTNLSGHQRISRPSSPFRT